MFLSLFGSLPFFFVDCSSWLIISDEKMNAIMSSPYIQSADRETVLSEIIGENIDENHRRDVSKREEEKFKNEMKKKQKKFKKK